MIVITGAAGFIGSYFVGKLNRKGFTNLILVDAYDDPSKDCNLVNKKYTELLDRNHFFDWLEKNSGQVEVIFHLGARTDTVGQEPEIYQELNLDYSKKIWKACTKYRIPLIYASSAATYGDGSFGFSDGHDKIGLFRPLNLYAWSKHDFDKWALAQNETPAFWAGLKFFNVYGPNEYHKGDMASVILHAYNKIRETGEMKLFRSHRPDFQDGEQKRDFVYVDDIAEVLLFFWGNPNNPGIYNVGTGEARSYLDLTRAVFSTLKTEPKISFIDTPEEIRSRYQYFTEADITKLREAGYTKPFTGLEGGVDEYILNFLSCGQCY